MQRRDFLKTAGIVSAGAVLSPARLFAQPQWLSLAEKIGMTMLTTVIIDPFANYLAEHVSSFFSNLVADNHASKVSDGLALNCAHRIAEVGNNKLLFCDYKAPSHYKKNNEPVSLVLPIYYFRDNDDCGVRIEIEQSKAMHMFKFADIVSRRYQSPVENNAGLILPASIIHNDSGISNYQITYSNFEYGDIVFTKLRTKKFAYCEYSGSTNLDSFQTSITLDA